MLDFVALFFRSSRPPSVSFSDEITCVCFSAFRSISRLSCFGSCLAACSCLPRPRCCSHDAVLVSRLCCCRCVKEIRDAQRAPIRPAARFDLPLSHQSSSSSFHLSATSRQKKQQQPRLRPSLPRRAIFSAAAAAMSSSSPPYHHRFGDAEMEAATAELVPPLTGTFRLRGQNFLYFPLLRSFPHLFSLSL